MTDLSKIDLPADYRLSDGEVDNIVYLVCKYTVGWPMRQADKAVCQMMMGDVKGPEAVAKLVEVATEYVWDHICGEPDEPTQEQLFEHIAPVIADWFGKTTPAERAVTS